MDTKDFTITLLVDGTSQEVFTAINNVPGWWNANMEGNSQHLNDEFIVRFENVHFSKHRLVEIVPNKKIVWLTMDSKLTFVEKQHEWTNTTISFEITQLGKQTEIKFTHHGLVPNVECYQGCSRGWNEYINGSLFKLLTKGKGTPWKN
jgi:uncharacterized protein YndB with AHSA1/START domain